MKLVDRLELRHGLDLVLLASLLLPITVVAQDPSRSLVGIGVATVGALVARIRRSRLFWLMAALGYGIWYWVDWRHLDNHMWLLPLWLLAVAAALSTAQPLEALARQARVLMVLVFAAAVVWKLRSPDFLSGTFFEFTLLTDPRFVPLATLTGVDPVSLLENRFALASGPTSASFVGASVVRELASLLTWGTVVVEGALLASWAVPRGTTVVRHTTLAVFCITAYAIAPVAGFGLILLAMGAATAQTDRGRWRYLIAMGALFAWSVLWTAIVL
jgi:hypothetical protein